MTDKPAGKAVRSPWTEGAWIMEARDAEGWEIHFNGEWSVYRSTRSDVHPLTIVEARPTPQEDQ